MKAQQLSDTFFVSAQITPDDIPQIVEQGFRVVINNRPDGEEVGQPANADIEKAAKDAGLSYYFIPASGRMMSQDVQQKFMSTLVGKEEKIFAFCRTGTRCSILWALSEVQKHPVDKVISSASCFGADLSGLTELLKS